MKCFLGEQLTEAGQFVLQYGCIAHYLLFGNRLLPKYWRCYISVCFLKVRLSSTDSHDRAGILAKRLANNFMVGTCLH